MKTKRIISIFAVALICTNLYISAPQEISECISLSQLSLFAQAQSNEVDQWRDGYIMRSMVCTSSSFPFIQPCQCCVFEDNPLTGCNLDKDEVACNT